MINCIKDGVRHLFERDGKGPDWAAWFIMWPWVILYCILRLCGVKP
jgi:hypothetical protein